jgi:hypothetical protein
VLNLKRVSKREREKEGMCVCPTEEVDEDKETAFTSDHEYEEKVIAH